MSDDDDDTPGRLADGTELTDVIADMPVEVRTGGSNNWFFAHVLWVEKHIIFPRVWVEISGRKGAYPFHTNYVRKYVEKKDKVN